MTTIEEDVHNLGIYSLDPSLEKFKDHLKYRSQKYVEQKMLIEKHEGSLEDFAQGQISMLKLVIIFIFFPQLKY